MDRILCQRETEMIRAYMVQRQNVFLTPNFIGDETAGVGIRA